MPKPKDFSESAVNLTNPDEVKVLLEKYSDAQENLAKLEAERDEQTKELTSKISKQEALVMDIAVQIRDAVEKFGSYQDLDNERYAVKYSRKTKVYNLEPFKVSFPKFTELCVKEIIDIKALEGQIKGKLITEEQLEETGVLYYSISHAFYVR